MVPYIRPRCPLISPFVFVSAADSSSSIREQFASLSVWKRGTQRAPHKPLLVLYALAELERGHRWVSFRDVDRDLTELLDEFGPPRTRHHPEYPFWRLQNDGVWHVSEEHDLTRRQSNTDPLKSELTKYNVDAGFSDNVWRALLDNPDLRHDIAQMLLEEHFPASLHDDILDAVGLDASRSITTRTPRDPQFRVDVLRAYDFRCAVCGFDLKLDARPLGLEAAHIQWRQARGPDEVTNGICLCALHHKMFDKGAIHFTVDLRLLVSEAVHGSAPHIDRLRTRDRMRIYTPQRDAYYPSESAVQWHVREVFRGSYEA
jgi:putative restriction endonuclease